jgi:hypothetical protein
MLVNAIRDDLGGIMTARFIIFGVSPEEHNHRLAPE